MELLDYWIEEKNGLLDRIVYRLRDGEAEYYRVVRLIRLLRTPKELAQIETLLDMHQDVVSAFKTETKARLVLLAVNSKKYGLIWCYGVAVSDRDLSKAEEWCRVLFEMLKSCLMGTYRQMVFRELSYREGAELVSILMKSDSIAVVVGLPEPREAMARPSKTVYYYVGTRIIEMVEEVVRGLVSTGREFAYLVLAQAVPPEQLRGLLRKVSDLATKYSTFEETASLGFYVTLPIAYTRSKGYGVSEGTARSRGSSIGDSFTPQLSDVGTRSIGRSEVETKGETVGRSESVVHTRSESVTEGIARTEGRTITETQSRAETRGWSRGESVSVGTARTEFRSESMGFSRSRSTVESSSETRIEGEVYTRPATTITEPLDTSKEYLVPYEYKREVSETVDLSRTGSSKVVDTIGEHEKGHGLGYKGNPSFGFRGMGVGGSGTVPAWGYDSGRSIERTTDTTIEEFKQTDEISRSQEIKVEPKEGDRVLTEETLPAPTITRPHDIPETPEDEGVSKTWYSPDYRVVTGTRSTSSSFSESRMSTRGTSTTTSTTRTTSREEFGSTSITRGRSVSRHESVTRSRSVTRGESVSRGVTESRSESRSISRGTTVTDSIALGRGEGYARLLGTSTQLSRTRGYSVSEGNVYGLGVFPGISASISVRRVDELRRLAHQYLLFEQNRIAQMLAQGGYHVLCAVVGDKDITKIAMGLIQQAYTPTRLYPEPLRVLEGDGELLLSAKTLSFDLRRGKHLIRPYRYMNLYTATEVGALTHPPRVEVPGIEVVVENIPEFRVPPPRSYDVEFGNVVSHETGGVTGIRFGIDRTELLHAGFFGITRSGKTNAAMVFVSRAVERLKARALILDWKKDWRRILKRVRGRLYVVYRTKGVENERVLKWNPLVPPTGVDPEVWRDTVVTWFCVTYGLGPRSYTLLWGVLDELYAERGVYEGDLTNPPTLSDMYDRISEEYERVRRGRRVTFEQLDIYVKTLARLRYYTRGKLRELFSSKEHTSIEKLLSGVVVVEAGEMADVHKPFLMGLLALSAFYYRKFTGASPVPEFIVLEEAHQVAFDPTVKGRRYAPEF